MVASIKILDGEWESGVAVLEIGQNRIYPSKVMLSRMPSFDIRPLTIEYGDHILASPVPGEVYIELGRLEEESYQRTIGPTDIGALLRVKTESLEFKMDLMFAWSLGQTYASGTSYSFWFYSGWYKTTTNNSVYLLDWRNKYEIA